MSAKSKKSATKSKAKTKDEAVVKSEEVEKTVIETEEEVTETEKVEETPEVEETETEEVEEETEDEESEEETEDSDAEEEAVEAEVVEKKDDETEEGEEHEENEAPKSVFKSLFAKKRTSTENILNVFRDRKIWGALIGEIIGTMFISIVFLTLGVYQPLYMFFIILGATMVTFGLSGANLNPIITAGMMASRRMSAIRGVLYILAQVAGAWLGYLIVNAFYNAGAMTTPLPTMAPVEDTAFWTVTFIEFFGAAILGFTFARALQFRKNTLAFASTIAGGTVVAFISVIVISSTFLSLTQNFILNPAVALMYQILPTGGDNIADLLANIGLALVTYVIFPVLGGVIGFYISDFASTLSGENVNIDCDCCKKKCCDKN